MGVNPVALEYFKEKMNYPGWIIFPHFVNTKLVNELLDDLHAALLTCAEIQKRNGVDNSEGTAHHLIGQGESFMTLLREMEKLSPYLEEYFQGKYILNSFGGNWLTSQSSYANNIHRDIRSFSGNLPLMLNTIVMLDEFTHDNGATWIMQGGHRRRRNPTERIFYRHAVQAIAPAGSVLMFNSNLWHAAGKTQTKAPRRSLTPMFSRPFIKPQFDYPRALGDIQDKYGDYLQQILGYKSRIPCTLSEWYQPKEKRMYQGD